ncbi:MAG: ADOP family duplicated permease [Gemmatimonadota bacterium]
MIRPGIKRLFRLGTWRRDAAAEDLHEEIELHVALRTEQLIRDGVSPAEAARQARQLFALTDTTIDHLKQAAIQRNGHMRLHDQWDSFWQDVRLGARRLAHEPGTTLFILVTLALGIGINVAVFSIADRVLLRGPQHVREVDRLVRLYSRVEQPPLGLQTTAWLPHSAFIVLRDGLRTIEGMAGYRAGEAMVGRGAASEMRRVSRVSSELFPLLGVRPLRGRFFDRDEDAATVAVISEGYWRTSFAADPDILAKTIAVDDVPHAIVGIAPAGFTGPELHRVDVWTPISPTMRNSMNMHLVARLRPDVSFETAAAEVSVLRERVEDQLPSWAKWLVGASYHAAPIGHDENGKESLEAVMARWLAVISAIILFISCANVANLLLARLARRRRELAVRVALGSGRTRLIRMLAIEGLVLAVSAAAMALVVTALVAPVIQSALFPDGSWRFTIVDVRVLGAVAVFALVTGFLVSLAPTIQAGRPQIHDALRGGDRGGPLQSPLRSTLTVVQAMFSVMLLVGAGLFLRSLQRVNAVDLGLDADRVLTIEARYERIARDPGETFSDWIRRTGLIERQRHRALLQAVRRLPGVESAAISVGVPFHGSVSVGLFVPGRDSIPSLPGGGPYVSAVGDAYFTTMGTRVREGRPFTASDREDSEPVVIVNETMARVLWPGRPALGACVRIQDRTARCARIVGVAADVHRHSLEEEPSMQFYVPIGQERGFSGSWLVVRPTGRPTTAWPALREALQNADRDIRSIDVRLLSQGLAAEVRPFRLGIVAFGISAFLALVVAGLGLYSIMAHAVAWGRHEIGVRLALGASERSIALLVVRRGTLLASIGIATGLALALALGSLVQPLLFETSASDPLVLLSVVILLEAVALFAAWLPARRATAVSPTETLRAI